MSIVRNISIYHNETICPQVEVQSQRFVVSTDERNEKFLNLFREKAEAAPRQIAADVAAWTTSMPSNNVRIDSLSVSVMAYPFPQEIKDMLESGIPNKIFGCEADVKLPAADDIDAVPDNATLRFSIELECMVVLSPAVINDPGDAAAIALSGGTNGDAVAFYDDYKTEDEMYFTKFSKGTVSPRGIQLAMSIMCGRNRPFCERFLSLIGKAGFRVGKGFAGDLRADRLPKDYLDKLIGKQPVS